MAVFTENWRNSRKSTADANEAIKEYNDALSEFAKGYDKYYSAKYAKDTLDKGVSFKNMADTIKDYKGGNSINDPETTYDFTFKYNQYVYLKRLYVPQDYIEALYEKAKTFDWYISENEALKNLPPQENLTDEEKFKMQDYIKTLLENRKCISVTLPPSTAPYIGHIAPHHDWYVLFNDGKLILSKVVQHLEYVPEHYIAAIYEEVSKIQKTAKDIYLEILKQKARALKKLLQIPHHEALELSAQMVGFKSWKDTLSMNERNARYAIERENEKKQYALEQGKDPLQREYNIYLQTKAAIKHQAKKI